jgi:hypothetical protein
MREIGWHSPNYSNFWRVLPVRGNDVISWRVTVTCILGLRLCLQYHDVCRISACFWVDSINIISHFWPAPRLRLLLLKVSAVGKETGYGLEDQESEFGPQQGRECLLLRVIQDKRPIQLSIQWVRGVKLPGLEADHSHPTTAEVKKTCIYTSTPLHVFMTWCLVTHSDNFVFSLYAGKVYLLKGTVWTKGCFKEGGSMLWSNIICTYCHWYCPCFFGDGDSRE